MVDIEYNIPLHFDQSDELFKRIIKDQGVITCRDKLFKEYITDSLKSFTDGFIILGNILHPIKNYKSLSNKYLLKHFYSIFYRRLWIYY